MKKCILSLAVLLFVPTFSFSAWFDSNFQYKRQITIPSSAVTGSNHNNFPILLTEANFDATFFSNVQKSTVNNMDIIFTDSTESTKLSREIVHFDASGNSLEAWVRIPTLSPSGGDTIIYAYYGYASANEPNNSATWNSSYAGVWHLQQVPTGAANEIIDSTGNVNHGQAEATMNAADQVYGSIGGSLNFDGTDDYINCGNNSVFNITSQLTISAWVKFDDLSVTNAFIVAKKDSTISTDGYGLNGRPQDSAMRIYTGNGFGDGAVTFDTTNWHFYTATINNTTATIYLDGVNVTTDAVTSTIANNALNLEIGRRNAADRHCPGTIDEVRVQSTVLSANWIATEFSNQNAPGSFCSTGGEIVGSTPTPTSTVSPTPSHTPTATPSHSPTESATYTPTYTHTPTASPTYSPTESATVTVTPTDTPTASPTLTATESATSTRTSTNTPTSTHSPTPTVTLTATPTPTITWTSTVTPPYTHTVTPTVSVTSTASPTQTVTSTHTHSPTFTQSPTTTATPSNTVTPTISATQTISPTVTPTPSITITSTITMTVGASDNLANVISYPNPYRGDVNTRSEIRFRNLPVVATIRIYTLTGYLIHTIEKNNPGNETIWNLRNNQGSLVSSGVYVYIVTSGSEQVQGKIALLR